MKNFEPRYRLVRYGMATKVEKASRQQRTYTLHQAGLAMRWERVVVERLMLMMDNRQAEEEPQQGVPGYGQGQGCGGVEEEVRVCDAHASWLRWRVVLSAYGFSPWLSRLHDLARKRCQPGVRHAMGVTRS